MTGEACRIKEKKHKKALRKIELINIEELRSSGMTPKNFIIQNPIAKNLLLKRFRTGTK